MLKEYLCMLYKARVNMLITERTKSFLTCVQQKWQSSEPENLQKFEKSNALKFTDTLGKMVQYDTIMQPRISKDIDAKFNNDSWFHSVMHLHRLCIFSWFLKQWFNDAFANRLQVAT